MCYRKWLVLVCFLCCSSINAQKNEPEKVNIIDLQEKFCAKDSTAVAAILYKKARTFFIYDYSRGFSVNTEYTYRIKIYKKEGLNWGNFEVPFYVGYENLSDETVKFYNGITYNIENGTIVKTKLNSEGNFKKKVNEYWNEASITMPNVKVGSIIEFQYILKSDNIVTFPTFSFQEEIPVNYAIYITEIPGFFTYKPLLKGFLKPKIDAKIVNGSQNYMNEYHQTRGFNYEQVNTVYTLENAPALKEEKYVDNSNNYKSSIVHELEKTQFPEVPEKIYSVSWEDVAKTIYKTKEFGNELDVKGYFEEDLKRILKDKTTETEQINAVFKFVQQKMNWDGYNGYSTDRGVKKAYMEGIGNTADINFILIAMLNYAGLNANPVLLSTINHGIPVFPNRTVFNYVIAAVDIQGKKVLLDATNKSTTLGILPLTTLNWTGRLIRHDGTSEEINLIPEIPSKETNNVLATIENSGKISGKFRTLRTDYEALRFRQNFGNMSNENYLEQLEQDWTGLEIEGYTVENKATDYSQPIIQTFNFTSNNYSEILGDKMIINPLLFFSTIKNPFRQEVRELPIYFGYPTHIKYNLSYEIPPGYTIESIPKSITITTPENIEVFTYKIVALEKKIQVSATIENNGTLLPASFYEDLKEFYQKVIEKQNEKIVLKKL